MPTPFYVTTCTIHKINGRELNRSISEATGHNFDPVAEGLVPGDDSSGLLEVYVPKDLLSCKYDSASYYDYQQHGVLICARSVISGYLLTFATRGETPYGAYQISYTWG